MTGSSKQNFCFKQYNIDKKIGNKMETLISSYRSSDIDTLIDIVSSKQQPLFITGKNKNAILISEEEWQNIEETLYLLKIPGMRESLIKGMNEPIENCVEELQW